MSLYLRYTLALGLAAVLFSRPAALVSASMWVDKNPYSSFVLTAGGLLKVRLNEKLQIKHNSSGKYTDDMKVVFQPDRKVFSFLPAGENNNDISRKKRGKHETSTAVNGLLSVTITAVDAATGVIKVNGFREMTWEKQKQRLELSGSLHAADIDPSGQVDSRLIGNLTLTLNVERLQPERKFNDQVDQPLSEEEKKEAVRKLYRMLMGESAL